MKNKNKNKKVTTLAKSASYCHKGGSGSYFYFVILSVSTWDRSLLCDDPMCPYNHVHLIGVIIQK